MTGSTKFNPLPLPPSKNDANSFKKTITAGLLNRRENAGTIFFVVFNKILVQPKIFCMLKWSAVFFVIAIVAAIFGFTGIAAGAASIAKTLFFIVLVIWLVLLVLGVTIFKK